jgi:DNA-binding LytR/AlgR family response regulator
MKQLREQLAEVDYLISCHRAYIININYAVSLTSRTSGNYQLQMLGIDKLIPVSRANTVEIKRALQK